ncbi:PLAT domain-containing protein 3-like [Coffea eugenioides]|uniref:PLAT domain-containing protein 3 n=1 Tax=Coffea arabica TaxID=13443 RepID=A0A6P6TKR5_COFAR|nr:PLAT domain-containing protein 3-like [Coffea arabica]XP_027179401.1 PLAT domain-containing protein 3-like [Coffea eugenioides]
MAINEFKHLRIPLFILLSIITISRSADPDCVYTLYIRTGSVFRAGTDSSISLTLYDANGYGMQIDNLVTWGGLMGPDYDYFERRNLDIFSGRGRCLVGPVCSMNLTSDGSGFNPGWYVNYVEVTTTGVHTACFQEQFTVEQWLATDVLPFQLTALVNYCYGENHAVAGKESKGSSSVVAEI